MKVLICLIVALNVAFADECTYKHTKDLDVHSAHGTWYNYARVESRPQDEHFKCLNYEAKEGTEGVAGAYKMTRYFVDDRTEEEHEMPGKGVVDVDKDVFTITPDDSKYGPIDVSMMCWNEDFEILRYGDADSSKY